MAQEWSEGLAATELASLLREYGTPLFEYSGRGIVTGDAHGYPADSRWPCIFVVAQLRSGQVIIACDMKPVDGPVPMMMRATGFEGDTFDGQHLVASELSQTETLGDDSLLTGIGLTFRANHVWVNLAGHAAATVAEVRYGMTNYLFDGVTQDVEGRAVEHALRLLLRRDESQSDTEHVVTLAALPDFHAIAARLRTLHMIDVTAEAIIALPDGGATTHGYGPHDLAALDEAMSGLVFVMGVGAGTKVQWVYRAEYADPHGEPVRRYHAARITKPFTNQPIIRARNAGHLENTGFLQKGYTAFHGWKVQFPLDHVIDAYLDAKAENDFLEARGAKLAIALESLKHHFVQRPNSSVSEYRFPFEKFKPIRDAMASAIRAALEALDVEESWIVALTDANGLGNLNRSVFRELIVGVAKEIGLDVSGEDLGPFIRSRNALVHAGQFDCVLQAARKKKPRPPRDVIVTEYLADMHLLDQITLRLLAYEGPYLNRSVEEGVTVATLAKAG